MTYRNEMLRAAMVFLAVLVSCSEAHAGQTRMPPEYRERHEAVERCLGVDVKNPRIKFVRTVPCPTSGLMRCMANYPFFPCGDITCGASGSSAPWDNLITLPDEYSGSFEHEVVHDTLYKMGRGDWDDHSAPEFARCQ